MKAQIIFQIEAAYLLNKGWHLNPNLAQDDDRFWGFPENENVLTTHEKALAEQRSRDDHEVQGNL